MRDIEIKSLDNKTLYNKDEKSCNAVERTIKDNPFAHLHDIPVEYYAEIQGCKVGTIKVFPMLVSAQGKNYIANCASGLSVSKEHRGKGIGTKLAKSRISSSPDNISIGAGLSEMSYPLYKKLGCHFFYSPRLGLLVNSHKFVKSFVGRMSAIIAPIVNLSISILSLPLLIRGLKLKKRYQVCKLEKACKEIEDIVNKDKKCFQEKHNVEWFNWVLSHSFTDNEAEKNHLYAIKNHKGEIEAFFMHKVRIKNNIRNIKNVRVTSLIEWGIEENSRLNEKDIVAAFSAVARKQEADIIEVSFLSSSVMKSLKRMGFIKMLDGRIMLYVGEDSPLRKYDGWEKEENWRLRPAYSDYGFC